MSVHQALILFLPPAYLLLGSTQKGAHLRVNQEESSAEVPHQHALAWRHVGAQVHTHAVAHPHRLDPHHTSLFQMHQLVVALYVLLSLHVSLQFSHLQKMKKTNQVSHLHHEEHTDQVSQCTDEHAKDTAHAGGVQVPISGKIERQSSQSITPVPKEHGSILLGPEEEEFRKASPGTGLLGH